MPLRAFFSLHRDELLRACKSELSGESSIEELARELCELLEPVASQEGTRSAAHGHALLGQDPAVRRARVNIEQLARRSRIPVLFLGEMGSGRRHSAGLLHAGTYPEGEFFELRNKEQLTQLERKIAALRLPSSALAVGGMSVFVPELGEASKPVQAFVSTLLGEHGLRLRLIAASRLPLTHACREGALRSDLMFGFSTTVELPNLRDRLADLPLLIGHFCARDSQRGAAALTFSDAALLALQAHAWPGNLTELRQLVERLQRLDAPGVIEPQHLTELGHRRSALVVKLPATGIDMADLERGLLLQALALTDNNRSRAARLLGLTRDQIRYRLSKLELTAESDGESAP